MKFMLNSEYKRRVFNECMLECMCRIHGQILNGDCADDSYDPDRLSGMANRLCRTFVNAQLHLEKNEIRQTKAELSEAVTFIQDCIALSESIAEDKAEYAKEKGVEMASDQEVSLSNEDKDLITRLFDEKSPELQVQKIRDATVKALVAEDQKAQEIKDSLNIANAQVANGSPEALKEAVSKIEHRGPTSLMNAILNQVTTMAVADINEHAKSPVSVGTVMKENAEEIRNRATMIYTLYEMSNVFGLHRYTPNEIKSEASRIYYGK